MGSGVAQGTQGVQRGHRLLRGRCSLALHALGLVHDDHRVGLLDQADRAHAVELVNGPVDDIGLVLLVGVVKALAEGGDVDDHDGDVVVDGKGAHFFRLAAVVDVGVVDHIVVDGLEVFPGNLQGLGHALLDGDAGHHDDELLETVGLVQFKDGTQVHIGLAGAGLHLNVKVIGALFQRLGLGQAIAQLHRLEVFQDLLVYQFQLVANAVVGVHGTLVAVIGNGKTALFRCLTTKEIHHSGNCLLLVVKVGIKL